MVCLRNKMGLILLIIQPFLMAASAANPAVIATGKYISHGRTLNTQFCQENNHAVTDKVRANTGRTGVSQFLMIIIVRVNIITIICLGLQFKEIC